MELKNFYRLIFTNSQEYFVKSDISSVDKFTHKLVDSGIVYKDDYIRLQLSDSTDPVLIKADKLFSVQQVRDGYISPQTKLWKLA